MSIFVDFFSLGLFFSLSLFIIRKDKQKVYIHNQVFLKWLDQWLSKNTLYVMECCTILQINLPDAFLKSKKIAKKN